MQKIRSTFDGASQWWEKQQDFVLFTCNMIIFPEQKAKEKGVGAVKAGCCRRDVRVTPGWAMPSPTAQCHEGWTWWCGPLTAPDEASEEPGPSAVQRAHSGAAGHEAGDKIPAWAWGMHPGDRTRDRAGDGHPCSICGVRTKGPRVSWNGAPGPWAGVEQGSRGGWAGTERPPVPSGLWQRSVWTPLVEQSPRHGRQRLQAWDEPYELWMLWHRYLSQRHGASGKRLKFPKFLAMYPSLVFILSKPGQESVLKPTNNTFKNRSLPVRWGLCRPCVKCWIKTS